MKLLFLGGYYPPTLLKGFAAASKIALDMAAHNLQDAIFKGLTAHQFPFDILNAPFLGSFPFYNRLLRVPACTSPDGSVTSVPYINLAFYKRNDIVRRVKRHLLPWCRQAGEGTTLLFYNFSMMPLARWVKQRFPGIKIILLVTDLQEFMAADQHLLTRINKALTRLLSAPDLSVYECVDAFVLLSPYMKQRLPVGDKSCIVIEGIYNAPDESTVGRPALVAKEPFTTILYSGNLGRRYGIPQLLEAFTRISNDSYRLWICGDGDGLPDVLSAQAADQRIKYLGVLPREEVLLLQQKATLLVNPRRSNEEYTRYSFPSKTMEYLASGTPTLMSRLASLPAGYEPHLYFFDDESVEGMCSKMMEIGGKPTAELQAFGQRARQFILTQKNAFVQSGLLIDLVHSLHHK